MSINSNPLTLNRALIFHMIIANDKIFLKKIKLYGDFDLWQRIIPLLQTFEHFYKELSYFTWAFLLTRSFHF